MLQPDESGTPVISTWRIRHTRRVPASGDAFWLQRFIWSAYSETTGAEGFFYLARHYRARSAAGILQRPFFIL